MVPSATLYPLSPHFCMPNFVFVLFVTQNRYVLSYNQINIWLFTAETRLLTVFAKVRFSSSLNIHSLAACMHQFSINQFPRFNN